MSIVDDVLEWGGDAFSNLGVDDLFKAVGLYGGYEGWFNSDQEKAGYQGKIPDYTAVRDRLPTDRASVDQAVYAGMSPEQQAQLGNATPEQIQWLDDQYQPRRPGEYGQRYFTDTTYAQTPEGQQVPTLAEAQSATDQQAVELTGANRTNHFAQGGLVEAMQALKNGGMKNQQQQRPPMPPQQQRPPMPQQAQGQPQRPPMPQQQRRPMPPQQQRPQRPQRPQMPPQGIAAAPQARYQRGPTDGMGDQVPAMIDGKQPAAMSHGEMVIPADVVGHLGNGNSEAGADQLYTMMDRIRQARTGSKQQGKKINPNTFLPK